MNVHVQLFAVARARAGRDVVELSLPPGAVVGDLRRELAHAVPQLAGVLPHVLFAVDTAYADDDTPIPAGAAVACIPPVSGG